MSNSALKRTVVCFIVLLMSVASTATAQISEVGELIRAGKEDANILVEAYLQPFGTAFGAGLNAGWVSTARPLKPLGFDLRVGVALATVPVEDEVFDITALGLSKLRVLQGSSTTPTIVGEDAPGPVVGLRESFTDPLGNTYTEEIELLTMPRGTGFGGVPAPQVQLAVGLIRGIEVAVRYVPDTDIADYGSVGLVGAGVKVGINDMIPGGKFLPIDISLQGGYTMLSASAQPEVTPNVGANVKNEFAASTWSNQAVDIEAEAMTANLLVGKTLPFISVFAGVGYQTSTMTVSASGNYPITSVNPDFEADPLNEKLYRVEQVIDPIDLELSGLDTIHYLAGVRLKIAILSVSATYTMSDYPVASVGVGLGIR